jgi:putative ABC transport system ATP-binding protein
MVGMNDNHDRPAVEAQAITKRYGRPPATALAEVSVRIARGRLTAVMGPSGSGKSTLVHCLAGLDTVDSGVVGLDGVRLDTLSERDRTRLRRERTGFVFQSFNLLSTLTVAENLLLPMRIAGRRVDQGWLDEVVAATGLADRMRHRPDQLSGGQQQRVAVGRALVGRPAVLFADEPTGNLDSRAGTEVLRLLRRSVDEHGQTVLLVTHDPGAIEYADRVLVLVDGELREDRPGRYGTGRGGPAGQAVPA